MLETKKSTTLTGTSYIEEETTSGTKKTAVATMHASVSEDGKAPTITKTVTNTELFLANREDVKADMDAFEDAAWELVE